MLRVVLPQKEDLEEATLCFEHSLLSLSAWEAFHEKPFFSKDPKTPQETQYYIDLMLVSPPAPSWQVRLEAEDYIAITDYINANQTATTFRPSQNERPSREIVTSELIYFWLVSFNIPFHPVETWHLNRLMTLIKICSIKQTKPKPMSKSARMEEMRRLNEQRRAALGTTG